MVTYKSTRPELSIIPSPPPPIHTYIHTSSTLITVEYPPFHTNKAKASMVQPNGEPLALPLPLNLRIQLQPPLAWNKRRSCLQIRFSQYFPRLGLDLPSILPMEASLTWQQQEALISVLPTSYFSEGHEPVIGRHAIIRPLNISHFIH